MINNILENPKVKERQENEKQAFIEVMKEMPIVTVACKKAGIDHSTYYRWCREDQDFLEQSEEAMKQGKEFLRDMNKSQLISLTKDKYWPAIKYYLEHNDPDYMGKNPAAENESLTPEASNKEIDLEYVKWEKMAHEFGERIKKEDVV